MNGKKITEKIINILPSLAVLLSGGISFFIWKSLLPLQNNVLFALCVGLSAVISGVVLYFAGVNKKNRKMLLPKSFIGAALCGAAPFCAAMLARTVFTTDAEVKTALTVSLVQLTAVAVCAAVGRNKKNEAYIALSIVLSFCVTVAPCINNMILPAYYDYYSENEPKPVGTGEYTRNERLLITDADFYVSYYDGSDKNDGTLESPFRTIQKARDAVRAMNKDGKTKITVAVLKGNYYMCAAEFTAEDSGTASCPIEYCAYGDGTVILRNNWSISYNKTVKVPDDVLARLNPEIKDSVICYDLSAAEITADDILPLTATGNDNTAGLCGDTYGSYVPYELYISGEKQTLASYPNTGFLQTGEVVFEGINNKNDDGTYSGDTFKISGDLAERIASWQTTENVWLLGKWKYDYSDSSTPLAAINAEKKELTTTYPGLYGVKEGAPYYFYNVLEELDSPGEWYVDVENLKLYLYPSEPMTDKRINFSLSEKPVLYINGAEYLSFNGFTINGSLGDAVVINGNYNSISECKMSLIGGSAVYVDGVGNKVSANDISLTGKSGIVLNGGDTQSLSPGNNTADNNAIHEWGGVYLTGQAAVKLNGVGNTCSHNDIYKNEREAIAFTGNNHIIEYNLIHNVCTAINGSGAVYSERHWEWCGTSIQYNCLYNLGSDGYAPHGIYLGGAISGIRVNGNLLVNIPGAAIYLGGGRNLTVQNNIIINNSFNSIFYDQCAFDGAAGGEYVYTAKNGEQWQSLYSSPYQSDIWKNAFPYLAEISDDFNNTSASAFAPNPANSVISENVIVNVTKSIGTICEKAEIYSTVQNNAIFGINSIRNLFTNSTEGDYSIPEDSRIYSVLPDFEFPEISSMGRY